MQAYVVSDNAKLAAQVREVLLKERCDCPESHIVPLAQAAKVAEPAELVVVVMSPDPEKAFTTLKTLSPLMRKTDKKKHILAVGPADAMLILRTIREANAYVDETNLQSGMEQELGNIQTQDKALEKPGKVFAVLAPSGGSGSSMVAANLAVVLAREHKSCALFDLKLGAGVLDALLDIKPTRTLADLCRNKNSMDGQMFDQLLARHPGSGAYLMAAPTAFEDVDCVDPEGIKQALAMARRRYPYVIVDMDRVFTNEQLEVLHSADVILLILRLDFTSLRNCRQTLEHLDKFGVGRQRVKLVFNRHGQLREVSLRSAEDALGMRAFKAIPEDPRTVNKAINNGVPVVVDSPRSTVARAIMEMAKALHDEAVAGK